jgi:6-phosphogluconolactonase (cycloisomerase 2 family)
MERKPRIKAPRIASIASILALILASCSDSPSPPTGPTGPTFGIYVANYFSTISAYATDEATGVPAAIAGSPFATGYQATDIALVPDGSYVYLASQGARTILAHRIGTGGSLTAVATGVGDLGTPPLAVAISHDGKYLYATVNNATIEAYGIGEDGALSSIGQYATGNYPAAVEICPDDMYLYVANFNDSNISAYAIGADGSLSSLVSGTFIVGASPFDIVIDAAGEYLYVSKRGGTSGSDGISLYQIGTDGTLEALESYDTGAEPACLALSPDGAYLYAANNGAEDGVDGLSAYRVGSDGGLTAIGSYAAGPGPYGVAVGPNGHFVYVTNQSSAGADGLSAYRVGTDGDLSSIGTYETGLCPFGIAIAD